MTNYLSAKLLNHALGNATYTPPANLYLGMHINNPTPAGDISSEMSGGSYSRQLVEFGSASPDASLTNAVAFLSLPAGVITYAGLWDQLAGGNLLFYGEFTAAKTIEAGGGIEIGVGEVVWGLD